MEERKKRDGVEKANIMEQAKIWEVEKTEFDQFESRKAQDRKSAYM